MSQASAAHVSAHDPQDVLADWIVAFIAKTLGVDPAAVSRQVAFTRLGLDSTVAVAMTGELAEWLGANVDPAAPYEYPTIEKLSAKLVEQADVRAALEHKQLQAVPGTR